MASNEVISRGTGAASNLAGKRKNQVAQLLAAVSVLSVSLGLAPTQAADCPTGQQCDNTSNGSTTPGQYTRKKLPGRMKSGTLTMTRGAVGSPSTSSTSSDTGTTGSSDRDKSKTTGTVTGHSGNMIGNHKDVMETTDTNNQGNGQTTGAATGHSNNMMGNHKDVMGTADAPPANSGQNPH